MSETIESLDRAAQKAIAKGQELKKLLDAKRDRVPSQNQRDVAEYLQGAKPCANE